MSTDDSPAVTILLPDGDRHVYAAAWAELGEVRTPDALDSLPADALTLRVVGAARPGPHLVSRLRDARGGDRPAAARTVPIDTGGPTCVLGTAAQLRDGVEPVLAPTAVAHVDVRAEPDGQRVTTVPGPGVAPDAADEEPFLSIVMRTQGTRPQCLEEALLCLAGQTVRSFEVVLAAHRLTAAARAAVDDVVAAQPAWLQGRIRVLPVEHGGRSAPLNAGFEAARGAYIAMLDDDDLVLAHWVETFRDLAGGSPGATVRAVAMQVQVESADDHGRMWPRAVAPLLLPWALRFHLVDHLVANETPCMAAAFPRAVVEQGLRFDEELSTTEDWDFLVRAVVATGCADAPEPTSIYRWWLDAGSSRHEHAADDWDRNHDTVLAGFEALAVQLPPGSLRRLHERRLAHRQELDDVRSAEREQVARLQEYSTGLEEHAARLQEMVAAATTREETLRKRVKKLRARLGEADD